MGVSLAEFKQAFGQRQSIGVGGLVFEAGSARFDDGDILQAPLGGGLHDGPFGPVVPGGDEYRVQIGPFVFVELPLFSGGLAIFSGDVKYFGSPAPTGAVVSVTHDAPHSKGEALGLERLCVAQPALPVGQHAFPSVV